MQKLFELEQHYLDLVDQRSLEEICRRRIREFHAALEKYISQNNGQ